MLLTLLYFVIVLGIVVCIHEFGHYLFAKRAGIYVYEFSIGMGPQLFHWNRKNDETTYSIRLFPIGGYVKMAGEEVELDQDIPENKRMQSKTWLQRFFTIIAGIFFNFILAIIVFFLVALIVGSPKMQPYISTVEKDFPSAKTNLKVGDKIVEINGKHILSLDHLLVELQVANGKKLEFLVEHTSGKKENITLVPIKKVVDGKTVYQYGFTLDNTKEHGVWAALKYAVVKTITLIHQMILIIFYLITGGIHLNSLAGPIGIFNVVEESAKAGFINVVYLIGFLSVNVGFINLLPIPAFDGGRLLFLVIEKIIKHPVKPEIENMVHAVGFILLMILMVVITWNDIIRLFG